MYFNIVKFIIILSLLFCVNAKNRYEDLSEKCRKAVIEYKEERIGKTITECLKMNKMNKTEKVCTHKECSSLEFPRGLEKYCTSIEDILFVSSSKVFIKQFNTLFFNKCRYHASSSVSSTINKEEIVVATSTTPTEAQKTEDASKSIETQQTSEDQKTSKSSKQTDAPKPTDTPVPTNKPTSETQPNVQVENSIIHENNTNTTPTVISNTTMNTTNPVTTNNNTVNTSAGSKLTYPIFTLILLVLSLLL